ncbi:MAG: AAA family ATPase, partial [Bacteroidota bacterium]
EELMDNILQEKEYVFFNYRNILTSMQFNLLKAMAKEGKVSRPNSSDFIKRYDFTQASSVNAALKSLSDKEMIYKEYGNYKVYDVFLSKWLERY